MAISLLPSTWNTLGLGVAASWAALSIAGATRPAAAADLFGITALGSDGRGDYKSGADRDSMIGFAGVLASRDMTIALSLLYLGRAGRNADMGAVILSTMIITAVDIWLVWRKKGVNHEFGVLTAGSLIWAVIGFGLRGYLD
ncbi:general amino acid permease [Purpureocillium lavendulum]|uniref:General amino acid permease n=1 Tax=Purpureocillium lavendulum TaxID=1247861 RepID=A0AB34FCN5_9HYPO|nr:general amino acid permease [Purpureocillium lavendulum]